MTIVNLGRRVYENGSGGTDHGTRLQFLYWLKYYSRGFLRIRLNHFGENENLRTIRTQVSHPLLQIGFWVRQLGEPGSENFSKILF
ncbi:MAG: hypothetical protein CM15mP4_1490 [Candidatus Neomarinimicrobiota bacterium]|nr:MAG: hypothetical protein CM15mP4_1490 [Candidatus Neomarinimicrobiota bacterium]